MPISPYGNWSWVVSTRFEMENLSCLDEHILERTSAAPLLDGSRQEEPHVPTFEPLAPCSLPSSPGRPRRAALPLGAGGGARAGCGGAACRCPARRFDPHAALQGPEHRSGGAAAD